MPDRIVSLDPTFATAQPRESGYVWLPEPNAAAAVCAAQLEHPDLEHPHLEHPDLEGGWAGPPSWTPGASPPTASAPPRPCCAK
ncbi:hypothetical protein [Kocuria aegyptia]|uniref:Uncharacterized protein n=1 Tax=Kocuria aegyptia TaxID=330943 RepID=A0ABN2L5H1_9MICC